MQSPNTFKNLIKVHVLETRNKGKKRKSTAYRLVYRLDNGITVHMFMIVYVNKDNRKSYDKYKKCYQALTYIMNKYTSLYHKRDGSIVCVCVCVSPPKVTELFT